jgi:hypothetical protein
MRPHSTSSALVSCSVLAAASVRSDPARMMGWSAEPTIGLVEDPRGIARDRAVVSRHCVMGELVRVRQLQGMPERDDAEVDPAVLLLPAKSRFGGNTPRAGQLTVPPVIVPRMRCSSRTTVP